MSPVQKIALLVMLFWVVKFVEMDTILKQDFVREIVKSLAPLALKINQRFVLLVLAMM